MSRLNSSVALYLSDTELLIVIKITPKERTLRKFLAFLTVQGSRLQKSGRINGVAVLKGLFK